MTDLPRQHDFLIPVICALREMGGIGRIKEVCEKVIENTGPYTSAQLAQRKQNGESVIKDRIYWARFYLVMLGYIQSGTERGIWKLTQLGESVGLKDSALIMKKYAEVRKEHLQKSRLKRQQENRLIPKTQEDESEDSESTAEQDEKEVESELLEKIRTLSPRNFEYFCKNLLSRVGFVGVRVTQQSNDGGFDGEGTLVVNPFVKTKIIFECKRFGGAVGVGIVRKLKGTGTDRGEDTKRTIITTGTFSKGAEEEAVRGINPVELIDGEALVELCKQHQIGVRERKAYDLDYEFFEKFKGDDE